MSSNKLDCAFLKATNFVDIVVDVATWQVLEEEIYFQFVLEHKVHRVDEWMISLEKDLLLILNVLNLFLLQEQIFVNSLHSVHLAHFAIRNQKDFAKAAFINDFADLKVFKIHLFALKARLSNQAATLALFLLVSLLG